MNSASIARSGAIMPARILSGIAIRDEIYAELKQEIAALAAAGIRPGLAAVLVGENAASQIYVRSKIAACEQLGLGSWMETPPAAVTTEELLALVARRNACSKPWTRRKMWTDFIRRIWDDSFRAARASWPALPRARWKFCGAAEFRLRARTPWSSDAATLW